MASRNDITGDEIKTKVASETYRNNIEKIYGNVKVKNSRSKWCSKSQKVLPIDEWYEINGYPSQNKAAAVYDDIEEYTSPIDGKLITSRSKRREDLRRSGCREYEGFEAEKKEADRFNAEKERKFNQNLEGMIEKTRIQLRDNMTQKTDHINMNWLFDK